MPAASAGSAAGAAPAAEAPAEEKPKEKTIFTVKLEKFDAAAKAKIIREVKAIMPNMNLVEVSIHSACQGSREALLKAPLTQIGLPGQEVCRECAANTEGELAQGGSREVEEDSRGFGCYRRS
jgi:hypothetical protein